MALPTMLKRILRMITGKGLSTFMTGTGTYNLSRWNIRILQQILANRFYSEELAQGIDYCRVDLMLKKDEIYFSEITLSPRRGKLTITPQEWDAKLGQIWHLSPASTFNLPLKLTGRAR